MIRSLVTIMFFVVALSACGTQRVYVQGDLTGPPDYTLTQSFFIGGLGQQQEVDATEVCGKKHISRVETKKTMTDTLLTIITIGIYSPRTVEVSCR